MYGIEYAESVSDDLDALTTRDRKRILDKIEEQLQYNPTQETRNKKILPGLKPPWEHDEPVWELRVGKYRVFYDVDEDGGQVFVRAVRKKPPHQATEQIL
jgi:mRNA-degrading endonuclease RelE of RelBE toxin-antitoxin system